MGGISGAASTKAFRTRLSSVAIGNRSNLLDSNQSALIIDNLPAGVDGILDPTSAYQPFGYSIDLPNHEIAAFDPSEHLMSLANKPEGGTVVRWLDRGSGRRPFVKTGDGRIALIDTGSGFGLAVSDAGGVLSNRSGKPQIRDLGSGRVSSERVNPTTVSIGDLTCEEFPLTCSAVLKRTLQSCSVVMPYIHFDSHLIQFDALLRLRLPRADHRQACLSSSQTTIVAKT